MSMYLKDLSVVSPNMARFVALELLLQSLTKKDIVKCLNPYLSPKMRSLTGEGLLHLCLTLVLTPAVKQQSVV